MQQVSADWWRRKQVQRPELQSECSAVAGRAHLERMPNQDAGNGWVAGSRSKGTAPIRAVKEQHRKCSCRHLKTEHRSKTTTAVTYVCKSMSQKCNWNTFSALMCDRTWRICVEWTVKEQLKTVRWRRRWTISNKKSKRKNTTTILDSKQTCETRIYQSCGLCASHHSVETHMYHNCTLFSEQLLIKGILCEGVSLIAWPRQETKRVKIREVRLFLPD